MIYSISKEEKEVLADLKSTIIKLNYELIELSIGLFLGLKIHLLNYLRCLHEFHPREIKAHGLEAILVKRALRFFGMDPESKINVKKSVRKDQPRGKGSPMKLTRIVKIVLLPIYWCILLIVKIRDANNVKNKFET